MLVNIDDIIIKASSPPVVLAYLFGSFATGKPGPLSDLDVAVLLENSLSKHDRFDFRLKLISRLSSLCSGKDVDLVVLNDSSVTLCHEVIKAGKLIFCKDKEIQLEFETYVMSRYLDRRFYEKRHADEFLKRVITSKGS